MSEDYGTTPAEDGRPEPLEERLARELPDFGEAAVAPGRAGGMTLVDPADEDVDVGFDTEKDEVARAVDLGADDGPAEEAAMHRTTEPPYDPDDSYLPDLDPEDQG